MASGDIRAGESGDFPLVRRGVQERQTTNPSGTSQTIERGNRDMRDASGEK
jgi:hypothetical protein